MSANSEKMRRARQSKVEVGVHTFTILRPTEADRVAIKGLGFIDVLKRFVIDWDEHFTELCIGIPGGADIFVPFDPDVFAEWVSDKPEYWDPITSAILALYESHVKKIEAAEKN